MDKDTEKLKYLLDRGLLLKEAMPIAKQYDMNNIIELPYFKRLFKDRKHLLGVNKNKTKRQIVFAIRRDYKRNGLKPYDIFALLRYHRNISIINNEYIPVKRKGSHHSVKEQLTKSMLNKQKNKRLSSLEKYEQGRGR